MKTRMSTTDQKINALKPGGRVVISEFATTKVVAERSGNGKTLRIVRESQGGFVVVMKMAF